MYKFTQTENRRKGVIHTLHGDIATPAFFPDATYGALKSVNYNEAKSVGVEQFVTTTLHIELNLGSDYLRKYGGIHKFLNWDRPILTDSGGFQVFSLIHRQKSKINKITDVGATFQNFKTGDYKTLTPEFSQLIQHNIGSDIRIVLDEPVMVEESTAYTREAMKRNTEWAKRSKKAFLELNKLTEADFNDPKIKRPLLTAVIQGGNNWDLRKESAESLVEIGFDIYGFGGLPMHNKHHWNDNAPKGFHGELIDYVADLIPEDKIRYGLGIGTPDDLEIAVKAGWDIFDTVLPTRNARHGSLYVKSGEGDKEFKNYSVVHIKSERYKFDESPVNPNSKIKELREMSRAQLRYLIKIEEASGFRLASLNNLEFYSDFMEKFR